MKTWIIFILYQKKINKIPIKYFKTSFLILIFNTEKLGKFALSIKELHYKIINDKK